MVDPYVPYEVVTVRSRSDNFGLISVAVNLHESVSRAPIELRAGCSWAMLDVEHAKALILALERAIRDAPGRTE